MSIYTLGREFGLRWFTPTTEVKLCGHATLASSKVLFACIGNESPEIRFKTLSGELRAVRKGDRISIFLPENNPQKIARSEVETIVEIVFPRTIEPADIQHCPTSGKLMLRFPDSFTRSELESLKFDIGSLVPASGSGLLVKGVIITLKGTEKNGCVDASGVVYDFVSRYFGPWYGIDEDPVTGSAHTVLTCYWSEQLGKTTLYARQCSARGGEIMLTHHKNSCIELTGDAVVGLEGVVMVE